MMQRPNIHKRNPIGTPDIGDTWIIPTPNQARQDYLEQVYREAVEREQLINQEMKL